ncbi:ligand-binding sensor domain-containing protein [Parapedobacter soli]|uniref:ligand-binding sensor domain-containing protein n=1 Tax=Parapedobacter soli TaxID=416955 RepID=UPI0021C9AA84|nr:two-component regulator propeller domain-containing protein [Parapedobacter soli]
MAKKPREPDELMRLLLLTYIVCMGLAIGPAHGQPFYFKHYQVENGLSNNAVLCSAQDPMGFMWFGTKDGLNRFDGYSFKVFHSDPDNPNGLGSNFVRALYVGDSGILWVGTDQGIFLFNPKSETFSLFHPAITNEILDIQGDHRGNIWFVNDLTLYRYDTTTDSLSSVPQATTGSISSFGISETGDVWAGTVNGNLLHYQQNHGVRQSYDLFIHSPKVVSQWIERVLCTNDGHVLVGTSKQGFKVFDTGRGTYTDLLTRNGEGTDLFIRDIIEHHTNEYWLATESGIFIYNRATETYTNLKKERGNPWSLSDNAVYTLCKDKENSIWAGTYFGGINHYAPANTFFEKYFPLGRGNTISGNAVREICADGYGNLWIGTEDDGLNKMDLRTGRITNFRPTGEPGSLAHSNIHGLLITGDTLWVGTFEHGLDLFNVRTGKVIRHYNAEDGDGTLHNNFIFNICRTQDGRILLATGRGLYEYVIPAKRFQLVPDFPDYIFYTTLFEDSRGTIWAGTWRDGLYYSNPRTGEKGSFAHHARVPGSIGSNRVNRIFEDSRANIWVATEGGLCMFRPDRSDFQRYGTTQGFPSNLILALLEDAHGRLWVTTSKGLVRFTPANGDITVFTKANGLLGDQFNYNSAYGAPDGTLYFGSVKGLIRFNPTHLAENTFQPPVYITGMQVYDRELAINQKGSPLTQSITFMEHLELSHNQSSFSIDFAALSYISPDMTEYAYKMEGLDNEWTHIQTNRKAYFTKLPPGDYMFRVNVVDHNGDLKGKETTLRITILPPFWASNPAFLLYVVLLIAIVWYSISSYHRRVREKNKRKLEQLRHRKEEELYRAKIDFFTNVTHEIRTPLTLIKAPLEKVMKKAEELPAVRKHLQTMERNTERLLQLTDQLLDFRKTEVNGYRLSFIDQDVAALVKENYAAFKLVATQRNIKLSFTAPAHPCIAAVDKEAFTQIIGNLLTNALKYAERTIEIVMRTESPTGTVTILVKNDGYLIPLSMREKIFETFTRLKMTDNQQGSGLGLALARSLAQLHKGHLRLASPENGMNVFLLTLPLKQRPHKRYHGTKIAKD